jgi:hypothetical protein
MQNTNRTSCKKYSLIANRAKRKSHIVQKALVNRTSHKKRSLIANRTKRKSHIAHRTKNTRLSQIAQKTLVNRKSHKKHPLIAHRTKSKNRTLVFPKINFLFFFFFFSSLIATFNRPEKKNSFLKFSILLSIFFFH